MPSRTLKYLAIAVLALPLLACATPTATTPAPGTPTNYQSSAANVGAQTPTGQPTVKIATDPKLGQILVDSQGMTLYRFSRDGANTSNCTDLCANIWPPLTISGGQPTAGPGVTGTLGTITRSDDSVQVTYNQIPLYLFSRDVTSGSTSGDGVQSFGGVWSVAKPSDVAGPTPTAAATATP